MLIKMKAEMPFVAWKKKVYFEDLAFFLPSLYPFSVAAQSLALMDKVLKISLHPLPFTATMRNTPLANEQVL